MSNVFIIFLAQKAKVVVAGARADPFDNHSCVNSSPCLVSEYPAAAVCAAARGRDLCDALPFSAPNLFACDRDRSDGILRGPEGRGGQFGGAAAVAGGVRLVAAAPLDFAVRSELRSGPQVW